MSYGNIYLKLKNQYKHLMPSSKVKNHHTTTKKSKRGHLYGDFVPVNEDKFIIVKNKQNGGKIKYRSSWEKKFLEWCDSNPNVTKIISEGVKIPYYFDGKERTYYPDFVINFKDEVLLLEIKPASQVDDPINIAKFEAAKKFAESRKIKFLILTENELKNLIKS